MTDPSLSLLTVATSLSTFTALLPDLSAVRLANPKDSVANDVHTGEIVASALTITVGLTASILGKETMPAVAAILCAATLVSMYEYVLSTPAKEVKPA